MCLICSSAGPSEEELKAQHIAHNKAAAAEAAMRKEKRKQAQEKKRQQKRQREELAKVRELLSLLRYLPHKFSQIFGQPNLRKREHCASFRTN